MGKAKTVIGSLALGAGLMYILDPDRGKRRRAQVRDKARHLASKTNDAIGKSSRDFSNRISGIVAGAESLFKSGKAPDEVLVARVRSKLGRVVSHPSSIGVTSADGKVVLSGPVLAREVDTLIETVSEIKGVTSVESLLDVYEQAGNVPGLQGGRADLGERCALAQTNWSPTTRMLVGAAGGALAVYAAKRKGLIGAASAPFGLGLVSRALTNLELKRIVGIGAGRRAIDIEKAVNIAAPVEEVFDFWTHHENFPRFMRNVREVRKIGEGRYHWVVAGPAGVSVEWDAEITKLVPNRLIEFKSLE
ncbi:MAG TPA: SRPBCC family protein, partial [Blastocatellia bacterium]|nr:SRPBCC family protein [Blastocatellia bacterium]